MFNERCEQNDPGEPDKPKAFSITLTRRALQYYFDHLKGRRLNLDDLCGSIRRRYEEPTRGLLLEWDSITLETIMSKNSGEEATECLNLLVALLEIFSPASPWTTKTRFF